MRFFLKLAFFTGILVVVGGGASFLTWRLVKARYAPPAEIEVRVDRVVRGTLCEMISAPGVIQPRRNVKIGAKITARITDIPVKEGDVVTAGDPDAEPPVPATVLVRLDDRDLMSRLRAAKANREAMVAQLKVEKATVEGQEADLAGLEARFEQTRSDYRRKEALLASGDIAEAVFDEAQTVFRQQQAQLRSAALRITAAKNSLDVLTHRIEAADADIEQAEEALEYTVIRAPMSGTVTVINAETGEMVVTGTMNNPGTVIMEIADLNSMILVAEVDEADVGKVAPEQKTTVHVQAYPDKAISGVVESIALTHRRSNQGTKYYRTDIHLADTSITLYAGLTANVDIQTRQHDNVLLVPSQAVLGRKVDDIPPDIREENMALDRDKTVATVVYRAVDGKAVVTPVRIGTADMTHTIVEAGLDEGDSVISGPYKVLNGLAHDRDIRLEDSTEVDKEKTAHQPGETPDPDDRKTARKETGGGRGARAKHQ